MKFEDVKIGTEFKDDHGWSVVVSISEDRYKLNQMYNGIMHTITKDYHDTFMKHVKIKSEILVEQDINSFIKD